MEQLHCRNSYCSHNFVGECNVISCTTGWTDHLNGQEHEELQGFALKYVNISSYQFHVLKGRNVDMHSDKGTAAVDYAIENVSILVVSPSVLLRRMSRFWCVDAVISHYSTTKALVWCGSWISSSIQPYIVLRFSEPCTRVLQRALRKPNMKVAATQQSS